MLYALARWIFNITKGFWTLFFIAAMSNYFGTVLSMQEKDFAKGFSTSIIGSLLIGSHQRLAFIVLGPILGITFVTWGITVIERRHKGGKVLRKYLRSIVDANQSL